MAAVSAVIFFQLEIFHLIFICCEKKFYFSLHILHNLHTNFFPYVGYVGYVGILETFFYSFSAYRIFPAVLLSVVKPRDLSLSEKVFAETCLYPLSIEKALYSP